MKKFIGKSHNITEQEFKKLGEDTEGRSLSDLVSIMRESIGMYTIDLKLNLVGSSIDTSTNKVILKS